MGFTSTEVGIKYPFDVVIADETGVSIAPEIQLHVDPGQPAPDSPKGLPVKMPLALNANLALPRPWKYVVNVTVGNSKAQLSFDAIFIGQRVQLDPEGDIGERGN